MVLLLLLLLPLLLLFLYILLPLLPVFAREVEDKGPEEEGRVQGGHQNGY